MQKQVISWRGSYFPVRSLVNYNGQSGQTSLVTHNQPTFTNTDLALSREGNRKSQRKRAISHSDPYAACALSQNVLFCCCEQKGVVHSIINRNRRACSKYSIYSTQYNIHSTTVRTIFALSMVSMVLGKYMLFITRLKVLIIQNPYG